MWSASRPRVASSADAPTRELTPLMPMTPPVAAIASICRSERLRGVGRRLRVLEWEAMTGRSESFITSAKPSSFRWETSISIPRESAFSTSR